MYKRQNEDVLALDHGSKIIPQNDLAAGGVFRGDDVDGLEMCIGDSSYRVAVPGCYASGFISIARPLVELGLVPQSYPCLLYTSRCV